MVLLKILNLERLPNCISDSRVAAIVLNGWILPNGGASEVEGLLSTGPTPSSFSRLGVARAVLQSPLSFIISFLLLF